MQRIHFGRTELLRQRNLPAFRYVRRQQQLMAMLINGALAQALNLQGRLGWTDHTGQVYRFLPRALALTGALAHPLRAGIIHSFGCNSLYRRVAEAPLDEEDDLVRNEIGLCGNR